MLKKDDWSFLKGKKSKKFAVLLAQPEEVLEDFGLHSLNSSLDRNKSMTFNVECYSIANDLPGQWHMQFTIGSDFIISILMNDKQGRYVKKNNPHCFDVKLSPNEEFRDRWGNRIVPFRMIKILD